MSERWGPRLWTSLAVLVGVTACLMLYGIASWPMADDEVPSLVELGLLDVGAETFSVPADQVGRLPRALPVWYAVQRFAIDHLPDSEVSYRLPSVLFSVLVSALTFVAAARWRGLWFASAAAVMVNGSQSFVYLGQLNRFYSMPLLLMLLAFVAMWVPRGGPLMVVVTGVLALLAVLSHNITLVLFVLAFLAAVAIHVFGGVPRHVLWRSGAAAIISLVLYAVYIRPLMQGWQNTGNPTPVMTSFAAHGGVPTLALALFGSVLAVTRRDTDRPLIWWLLVFAGGLVVLQTAPINWNPRYFIFLMPAMWVMAAYAVASMTVGLNTRAAAAWYACVIILLLPGLVSHFTDGSRHDYRRAAEVVLAHATGDELILSDDAETISYYLPSEARRRLLVRTKVTDLPASEFLMVIRSNVWMPQIRMPSRRVDLLAEISRRRFDHFSHVLRVYRVARREGI